MTGEIAQGRSSVRSRHIMRDVTDRVPVYGRRTELRRDGSRRDSANGLSPNTKRRSVKEWGLSVVMSLPNDDDVNKEEGHLPWNPFNGPHKFAILYYAAWAIIFGSIAILAVIGVIK